MISSQNASFLDSHFARFLADKSGLSGKEKSEFRELVENLSMALGEGHSCLPVDVAQAKLLGKTTLVSDGGLTPLVLHRDRLYLHRYYIYESRLARQARSMAAQLHTFDNLAALLTQSFGANRGGEVDWQKKAGEIALQRSLCIISGGPGTGKTSTVVKIIALLLTLLGKDIHIALAAPTGKAAMRLRESISSSLQSLPFTADIIEAVPNEAWTLHRLLGVRRFSPQFRHSSHNPLSWDVVVVDEASMVDLAMMSKLVDALKPSARLILLGDKDQLASVESGAVLADLIASLPDNTVELQKTYRFDVNIKQLAAAINDGDAARAWSLLTDREIDNVSLLRGSLDSYIGKRYEAYMAVVAQLPEVGMQEVFRAFHRFQVLCGVRQGPHGVGGINMRVERYLAKKGYDSMTDVWYSGRPILITRNDYSLDLYNGDIGICLPDPIDTTMKVWFERPDGSVKGCLPYRLPRCETVFAMTIHKSQGSECDEVLVVLPPEDNRILSRELVYTAVTRAKQRVQVAVNQEVLQLTLARKIARHSGLAE